MNEKLFEEDQAPEPSNNEAALGSDQTTSALSQMYFAIYNDLDGNPETAKCKAFGKYLTNREAFLSSIGALPRPEMVVEETASIALCKDIEPSVAAVVADDSFVNAKWNSALKYGSIACEGGAFDGCAIASRILMHHWQRTEEYKDAPRQERKREAKRLAALGWAEKNLRSGLALYDIEVNSLCNRNTTDCIFEELVSELQQIGGIGWEVRVARSCLTNEGGLAGALDLKKQLTNRDCAKACDNLEILIDEENLDPVSMIWARSSLVIPNAAR